MIPAGLIASLFRRRNPTASRNTLVIQMKTLVEPKDRVATGPEACVIPKRSVDSKSPSPTYERLKKDGQWDGFNDLDSDGYLVMSAVGVKGGKDACHRLQHLRFPMRALELLLAGEKSRESGEGWQALSAERCRSPPRGPPALRSNQP
jgi:hypothetical protein